MPIRSKPKPHASTFLGLLVAVPVNKNFALRIYLHLVLGSLTDEERCDDSATYHARRRLFGSRGNDFEVLWSDPKVHCFAFTYSIGLVASSEYDTVGSSINSD